MNIDKINPNTSFVGHNKIYYETIESTNAVAKSLDLVNGTIVIAEEQTKGRGRMGREWLSDKGKGICMSILISPQEKLENISIITLVSGLAVCKALDEFAPNSFKIKWPNDIVNKGKKVCGILAESVTKAGAVKIIIGVGINVNNDNFPDDLKMRATSLYLATGKTEEREFIINRILEKFEEYYTLYTIGKTEKIINEYKKFCVNLGREVFVLINNETIKCVAEDINIKGELAIKKEDGTLLNINSGEVSIRGIYGYI